MKFSKSLLAHLFMSTFVIVSADTAPASRGEKSATGRFDANLGHVSEIRAQWPQAKAWNNNASADSKSLRGVPGSNPGRGTHSILSSIARHESNNTDSAIGDDGMSRGRYMLSEAAWSDVNSDRRTKRLKQYDWSYAHHTYVSREYARAYLKLVSDRFRSSWGRYPNERESLELWRRGFAGYRRVNHPRNASFRK